MAVFINYILSAFLWSVIIEYSLCLNVATKYSDVGSYGFRNTGHENSKFLIYVVLEIEQIKCICTGW